MRRNALDESYRYFLPTDRDRHWGIHVTGIGQIVQRSQGNPDHGHPYPYYYTWDEGRSIPEYGVLYITQGKGVFESKATGVKEITPGNIVILFPNVWHRYRPADDAYWTYHWVHFEGDLASQIFEGEKITPEKPILQTGLNESILHAFLTLWDRAQSEPLGYQQLLAASVIEILGIALAAHRAGPNPDRQSAVAREAAQVIEQHVESPLDMKELASSLYLSYDRFRHVFKQHTGMAPYQYQLEVRISRAKMLLTGTQLSVKEVAGLLQFEDPYHFSRIFKKKTGVSPTEWRDGLSHL